jgi:hypothetical protein
MGGWVDRESNESERRSEEIDGSERVNETVSGIL